MLCWFGAITLERKRILVVVALYQAEFWYFLKPSAFILMVADES
jgi:hypothetical protein